MSARDAKVLQVAGITVSEVARTLKRSRQTVSRGVRNPNSEYFRLDDFLAIHKALLRRDAFIAGKFVQYLQANFPDFNGIEVRDGSSIEMEFDKSEMIWVLCHSFDEIESVDGELAERIIRYLRDSSGECTFVFSDKSYVALCNRRFEDEERRGGAFRARWGFNVEPGLRSQATLLIFVRNDQSSVFALTEGGLARLSEIAGRRIFRERITPAADIAPVRSAA